MYMNYPYFYDLKKMALACRSKKNGKLLTSLLRLWYDNDSDSIKLISRSDNIVLMETFTDNITQVMVPNTYNISWISNTVAHIYGICFKTIQGYPGIKQHNSYLITFSKTKESYVYMPKQTEISNGKLIRIADYYEDILDNKWKNEYTQTSKKNRAAFTALHKIIPFYNKIKPDGLTKYQYNSILHSWSANYNDIIRIVNLVMTTPKPTAKDIEIVRRTLNIYTKEINLRTLLQKLVNEQRYNQANKDGKISIVAIPNYAR